MRIRLLLVATAVLALSCCSTPSSSPTRRPNSTGVAGDWRYYGHDAANTKFSELEGIDAANVSGLHVEWVTGQDGVEDITSNAVAAKNAANREVRPGAHEVTPLAVGGILYTTTPFGQVEKRDGATGRLLKSYDPQSYKHTSPPNNGWVHRGVAYWENGQDRRIVYATADARLIELDAETLIPLKSFGRQGELDLAAGLQRNGPFKKGYIAVTSPPVICRDVVIVGSAITDNASGNSTPPGDVQAFDVRTGKTLWKFETIPQAPNPLAESNWKNGSWRNAGSANVWSIMSADLEAGLVYLPVSTPTNDWYGGARLGDNRNAESLVCLECASGVMKWAYQLVHHGLWDYDPPAAPNLLDIEVDGKRIKAVAQVTKQAFTYVFDRMTGEPVWPIVERPVGTSDVPGEEPSPTQPFPTKPPAFDRQGVEDKDLISLSPELNRKAREIVERYKYGPLFTPPTHQKRGSVQLPGWVGGASWAGAAVNPATGQLYVSSVTSPIVVKLEEPTLLTVPRDVKGKPTARYLRSLLWLDFTNATGGKIDQPVIQPPYGRVTAIDMNKGDFAWGPAGDPRSYFVMGEGPKDLPAIRDAIHGTPLESQPLGWPRRGHLLLTRDLLFVGQEGIQTGDGVSSEGRVLDQGRLIRVPTRLPVGKPFGVVLHLQDEAKPTLRAIDPKTGKLVYEVPLPGNVMGAPMTFLDRQGKQKIVLAIGGGNLPVRLVGLGLHD